jgi:hypothetical protein
MERVGDEVRRELARFGPAGAIGELVSAWPELVGEAIAANAWPARVSRDGTLYVNTADSVWAFELGQQAPVIVERLRAKLGGSAPKALRFAPGHLPEPAVAAPDERPERAIEPTAEEQQKAAELASVIDDPELRERVTRAVAASLARTASGRAF